MSFWDFLAPPTPSKSRGAPKTPTAAELSAALAEAEQAAEQAEAAAAEVAQRRAAMLLTADDPALDVVERELQLATRSADKAAAAVAALRERVTAAEQRERQEALDGLHTQGEAHQQRGVELMRKYGSAAVQLVALVKELQAEADSLDVVNKALAEAGDPRRLPTADSLARPEDGPIPLLIRPVWEVLRVPSSVSPHRFLFPAVDDFGMPLMERQVVDR